LVLEPNKAYETVVEKPFRMTMAALEVDNTHGDEITQVMSKSKSNNFILCTLHPSKCLQQMIDLEFYEGQTLSFFAKGRNKVHLTGYILQEIHDHDGCDDHRQGDNLAVWHPQSRDSEDSDSDDEDDDNFDDTTTDDDDDEDEKQSSIQNKKVKREAVDDSEQKNSTKDSKVNDGNKKTKMNKKSKKSASAIADNNGSDIPSAKIKTESASGNDIPKKKQSTDSGLLIEDIKEGKGPEAKLGRNACVYYTGRLKKTNGVFDSCTSGKPFSFKLGAGQVIRGWDEGVKGMRVGGKRRLTIPPSMAYGNDKLDGIPPLSTLVFDVELKAVN
ncbi:unnamed protein product, partial [Didymodactylos carnosus]